MFLYFKFLIPILHHALASVPLTKPSMQFAPVVVFSALKECSTSFYLSLVTTSLAT